MPTYNVTIHEIRCPYCKSYIRSKLPNIGPSSAKCHNCGKIFTTGIVPWSNLSGKEKILYILREIFAPSFLGSVIIALLLNIVILFFWAVCSVSIPIMVIGSHATPEQIDGVMPIIIIIWPIILLIRLVYGISSSVIQERRGTPPVW